MNPSVNSLPKTLLAFFWHFMKRQWPWFLAMQIVCLGWSIDHTIFPYVLELLIDAITKYSGDRSNIWAALATPLIFGACLWLGVEICYRLSGFIGVRIIPRLEADVRMDMFEYVQKHSHIYFSTHFAGSLANKISDMPRSMTHLLQLVMTLFVPVIVAVIITLVFFAKLHPLFAVILCCWLAAHALICLSFSRKCDQFADIHAESRSLIAGKIVDGFTNHLNIKLFSRHNYERDYLFRYQKDEQKKHAQSLKHIEKMKMCLGIAAFIGPGIILNCFMIYCWQHSIITTGEVVFISNTSWNITIMAWLAGLEIPNFFKEIGVCRQALTVIQDPHDIVDMPGATPLKVTNGAISFDSVSFKYTPNQFIFRDKNITLNAGDKVGLVGFSGSGKTTFVHLILRYFEVEGGKILIDGQDISKVTQDSLRSQIAMIPQEASLFHRTLLENIRYGRLEATDEEVIEAAKQANCHEFIEKSPEKYYTLAGERGVTLSGGQRQRIAIARAILKNAPILILDEATSALDSVTERQIQDSLDLLMKGRTCIVIAHRLSTLSGMDRILVFKEGKVVEDGTHDELLSAGEHYAEMWNMQAGGFLPEDPSDTDPKLEVPMSDVCQVAK